MDGSTGPLPTTFEEPTTLHSVFWKSQEFACAQEVEVWEGQCNEAIQTGSPDILLAGDDIWYTANHLLGTMSHHILVHSSMLARHYGPDPVAVNIGVTLEKARYSDAFVMLQKPRDVTGSSQPEEYQFGCSASRVFLASSVLMAWWLENHLALCEARG